MAGKKPNWTPDQQKAVSERKRDVLVTASAGTGKTAVLSGRCVDIVADSAACPDVRNVLVLTFTEAAAAEMKTRIGEALKSKYIESRDPHLVGRRARIGRTRSAAGHPSEGTCARGRAGAGLPLQARRSPPGGPW